MLAALYRLSHPAGGPPAVTAWTVDALWTDSVQQDAARLRTALAALTTHGVWRADETQMVVVGSPAMLRDAIASWADRTARSHRPSRRP
jgi:hypothetical protein